MITDGHTAVTVVVATAAVPARGVAPRVAATRAACDCGRPMGRGDPVRPARVGARVRGGAGGREVIVALLILLIAQNVGQVERGAIPPQLQLSVQKLELLLVGQVAAATLVAQTLQLPPASLLVRTATTRAVSIRTHAAAAPTVYAMGASTDGCALRLRVRKKILLKHQRAARGLWDGLAHGGMPIAEYAHRVDC
jgi:hypothetical protein